MNKIDIKVKDYYIVYFDVLGYKAFFEDSDNDFQQFLLDNIALVNDAKRPIIKNVSFSEEIKYKTFSDNCIILVPSNQKNDERKVSFLINYIAKLQLKILKDYGIPIRGSITKGEAYIDDNIVFGKGLISAVKNEDSKAIYPRIIIDESIVNLFDMSTIENVKKDDDDVYYVDYFSLLCVDNIFLPDPEKKKEILQVRDNVYKLVNKYGHYKRNIINSDKIRVTEGIISKYLWLLCKYNEEMTVKKIPCTIKYKISLYKKWYKFEIVDLTKNPWPIVAN